MNNNNYNINDLNNIKKSNIGVQQSNTFEQLEQTAIENSNYEYLKGLNRKIVLFQKETEQSIRR